MKFEVRQPLPRSAEVTWRELFSERYEAALAAHQSGQERTLVDEVVEGAQRVRRTAMESAHELPGAVARALGIDRLRFMVHEILDDDAHAMTWRVEPQGLSPRLLEKVDIRGGYRLVDVGDGTCERIVNGEINVAIPLVGGKIEQAITDELRASYDSGLVFARTWLQEHT